jgi:DNA-binding FadR family transcriptional regulator
VARSRTHELVLQRIEQQIVAGNLSVGDRLPSEPDFAVQLGVSRSPIRGAVRILEAQGVPIQRGRRRSGLRLRRGGDAAEALTRLLRLHLALSSFDWSELVEARRPSSGARPPIRQVDRA